MTKTAKRSRTNKPLKIAGLFAGIGGLEKGLSAAGHSAEILCEIEPAASEVLRSRFRDVPLHPDVRKPLPISSTIDLVAAGFPCQDLSQAGTTKGLSGEQSSLVSHVFALLRKREVPWVLLENVSFMLHLAKGHAMEYLIGELEKLGYRWAYRVMDTMAFGLPQRRERVYLVASLDADPRRVLFRGDYVPQNGGNGKQVANGFYWTEGTRGLGWAVDAVPTLKGGSTVGIPSPPAIWLPDGRIVTPDIRDAERLQGFPAGWTQPAERVARRSSRWKLVGNAVSVRVAEWIGERLTTLDGDATLDGMPLPRGLPWPRCAWGEKGSRYAVPLSTWPVNEPRQHLSDFLRYEPQLLSHRATKGFLDRFRKSSLSKPEGFVVALEHHLRQIQREQAAG